MNDLKCRLIASWKKTSRRDVRRKEGDGEIGHIESCFVAVVVVVVVVYVHNQEKLARTRCEAFPVEVPHPSLMTRTMYSNA